MLQVSKHHPHRIYVRQMLRHKGWGRGGAGRQLDNDALARAEYECAERGTVSALGTRCPKEVGKMLRNWDRGFGTYDQTVLIRLFRSAVFAYAAPSDMFLRDYASYDDFFDYAKNGDGTSGRGTRKVIAPGNTIAFKARVIGDGLREFGEDFLNEHRFRSSPTLLQDLTDEVRDSGVPRDALRAIGDLVQSFEKCGGCGKGAPILIGLNGLLDAIWERREDIHASLHDETQFMDLAQVYAAMCIHHRLQGDRDRAYEAARGVEDLVADELADRKRHPQLLVLRTRVKDALDVAEGFHTLLEDFAETEGVTSDRYLGVLQCAACQAVFEHVAASETLSPKEALERAKAAQRVAETRSRGQPDEVRKAILDRGYSLAFLEGCLVEKRNRADPHRLCNKMLDFDRQLSRDGLGGLEGLAHKIQTPLRRAKVYHWLWLARGQKNVGLLLDAMTLLSTRPFVKNLCVLDVGSFREELIRHLPENWEMLVKDGHVT